MRKIDQQVGRLMKEGNIPGLTLVIINNRQENIRTYGYADLHAQKPVGTMTLFEIGSCSKAFTALAARQLSAAGRLNLNGRVSDYIPFFRATYKDSVVDISLLQLLHHSSGIRWESIAAIPEAAGHDALEKTVRAVSDIKLRHLPGTKYEYATVNYDILAFIIQRVTGQSIESYVKQHVLDSLGMQHTAMGMAVDSTLMATGYKTGFFYPRAYKAPAYAGNNAAGYIVSNGRDMALWLRFQMGLLKSPLHSLALQTQQRDETVPLHDMASYAMGWDISLSGNQEISHSGWNPNFTSYMAFRKDAGTGVVVLANSNSPFTDLIGETVMKVLTGEKIEQKFDPGDRNDRVYSLMAGILALYILLVLGFLVLLIVSAAQGKRQYTGITGAHVLKALRLLVIFAPFLYGLYLFPEAFAGFNWRTLIVWSPPSLHVMVVLIVAAFAVSYLAYIAGLCFPEQNRFKRMVPQILLVSILSGMANMVVIALITTSLSSTIAVRYLVFYYLLTLVVYLLGRRFVQVNLIRFTRGVVYELRMQLIGKIMSTSYQRFEQMDRGRVYTVLNDDVNIIGDATNTIVMLVTSAFTALGAFIYLGTIALWATVLTLALILFITLTYYAVSRSTDKYFEKARDTQNDFLRLINGLIDGYKEISMHRSRKKEYKQDIDHTAGEYRNKISVANIRFVNAFLVGESSLVLLLGLVVFALPKMFGGIQFYTVMSFVLVLLYLIGPVNDVLNSIPALMQLKVAWKRIRKFLQDIPADDDTDTPVIPGGSTLESLTLKAVQFHYQQGFSVGPINLEARKGEVLFIVGGNGSGKTTLAKLITGLYEPDEGQVLVNGEVKKGADLGGCFSAVFSPAHLFEKLYNIDCDRKQDEITRYLKILDLDKKVRIEQNRYSTISLSGGQRKRLALLQCYLEDAPIYLFDEWAADQDPDYRYFFYRTLLPEMKKKGKIVIAITHDDHYFDVADHIYKMNQGKLEHHPRSLLYPGLRPEESH
nr:cyclic peptide export ABC transporter [Chitinophaga varians]